MGNHPLCRTVRMVITGALVIIASGCASSRATVDATKEAWQSDPYVSLESDPRGHASRILDMPAQSENRTMQVGALRLPVHLEAGTDSEIIAWLDQGAAVTVTEWIRFVRAPETSSMSEIGDREFVPTWARVDCGEGVAGYVGARSLVNPRLFASMDEEASRALAEGTGDDSGQGFSEKRKKRLVAVKGAAGSFEQKGSDYPAAESVLALAESAGTQGGFSGQTLAALDPGLAARIIEEQRAKEAEENEGQEEDSGGLLGGFGSSLGLDSPEVKMGIAIADIVGELLAESEPTPLDEYMLARECMAAVLASAPMVSGDDPDVRRLRKIGDSIVASCNLPYPLLGYQFILQDDLETVNAFASPGGAIFFTTGMLEFLQNDDELAVVLGHEIAHMEERHGLKMALESGYAKMPAFRRIFKLVAEDRLEAMVENLLEGVDLPGNLKEQALAEIQDQVISLARKGFEDIMIGVMDGLQQGQDQAVETAADLRGMSLAAATGYDPTALFAILERVEAETGDYGGASYSAERLGEAVEVSPLLMASYDELMIQNGGPILVADRPEPGPAEKAPADSDPESKPVDDGEQEATVVVEATDDGEAEAVAVAVAEPADDSVAEPVDTTPSGSLESNVEPVAVARKETSRLVFEIPADTEVIGRRMLAAFFAAEDYGSSNVALAATTTRRIGELAEAGTPASTVALHRVVLDRDEIHPIAGSESGMELLMAEGRTGYPHVLGGDSDGLDFMNGVRSHPADQASDRPFLVWDRRADRTGWKGWVVVLAP